MTWMRSAENALVPPFQHRHPSLVLAIELQAKFTKDPIGAVEQLLGVDLPDDLVEKIIDGVKAKISLDKVGDALEALGGLFGKK